MENEHGITIAINVEDHLTITSFGPDFNNVMDSLIQIHNLISDYLVFSFNKNFG